MDPNDIKAYDVYELGLWMVKVLYCSLVMAGVTVALAAWNTAVTWRSSQDKRRLTAKVEALLSAIQSENRMKEAQEVRTKSNLKRTEEVLEKVAAAAAVAQQIPHTPSDTALKVVVINAPDHPVPVAPGTTGTVPEGVAVPDSGIKPIINPRPTPKPT